MSLKNRFVLSFDIGTTHIKAGLVDLDSLKVIKKTSKPSEIIYPRNGWAEVDPEKLWKTIIELSRDLDLEAEKDNIEAIVFSPYLASVVPVDENGNPLRNVLIWLDERAHGLPEKLWRGLIKIAGYNLLQLITFLRVTGGAPSKTGKDPISKILWIKKYERDIYDKTYKFLDMRGYLINKATGKFLCGPDDANLTWLVDTRKTDVKWHKGLIKKYGLDENKLPRIAKTTDIVGKIKREAANDLGIKEDTVVVVGAGDLTAAAIGTGAVKEGETHIYIGTSDWIGAHISKRKVDLSNYIGSIMSGIPDKYLLVAEQEIAAGALEWAMDIVDMKGKYGEVEKLVEQIEPGSRDLLFLPWFYGERSPIDDPFIRGGILNIKVDTTRGEILRSILEGISLNIRWAFGPFEKIVGRQEAIRFAGGGALFDAWGEILSNVLRRKIQRVKDPQNVTITGSAIIASVAIGVYNSFEEAARKVEIDKSYKPDPKISKVYDKLFDVFTSIYKNLRKEFKKLNRS